MINRPEAAPRALALVLAGLLANRGYDKARVCESSSRTVSMAAGFFGTTAPSRWHCRTRLALVACDELDAADRCVPTYSRRRRGSVLGFAAGSIYRVWIDASRGHIDQAAGHLRA